MIIKLLDDYKLSIVLPKKEVKLTIITHDGDYLFEKFTKEQLHHIAFVGVHPIDRNKQYTPWQATEFGEIYSGEGSLYLHTIQHKLLPFLKSTYNLRIDKDALAFAGASFGALISLYSIFTFPHLVSRYFLLSPSMWYPDFLKYMKSVEASYADKQIYWYVGENEGVGYPNSLKNMVTNTFEGVDILKTKLHDANKQLSFETDAYGIHRHTYFTYYFQKAVRNVDADLRLK